MALAVRTNEPMQAFGIKLNQARIGVADFNPLVLNHPDPMGGALGCGWHRLVGCSTGSCPLMATPLRGITYGAGLGHIWASFR